MNVSPDGNDPTFERWRTYLVVLARLHLGRVERGFEASDLVQQTLLDAYRDRATFRGRTNAEKAAWLHRLLTCNLADAWRARHRAKRDADREMSLEAALEASSRRIEQFLAAEQSSPSQRADRNEQFALLAAALTQLPDAQRDAVVLHYFEGQSLDAISAELSRTPAAVAGLLKRGLKYLRALLNSGEP
ncbi:MAG: sigma-70 family RNA polymerase sigma factor [Gemmataceae bacterium]